MAASPENRLERVRDMINWVNHNRVMAAVYVAAITLPSLLPFSIIPTLENAITNSPPGRAWNEREASRKEALEAVAQAEQNALKADFETTDGVDRTKTAERSWLLTITRPSSTLGGSPQEILGRVATRIVDETGCQSIIITEAVVDYSFTWPWSTKPTVYSAAATNCPQ